MGETGDWVGIAVSNLINLRAEVAVIEGQIAKAGEVLSGPRR